MWDTLFIFLMIKQKVTPMSLGSTTFMIGELPRFFIVLNIIYSRNKELTCGNTKLRFLLEKNRN